MKGKKLFLCMLLCLCMSGCAKETELITTGAETVSDPFSNAETDESQVQTIASYGIGYAGDIQLNGNTILVPVEMSGGRKETKAGLLIYIDGILQEYSIDSGDNTTMQIVDVPADTKTIYSLNVAAACDELENHYLNIVSVLLPEYVPENKNASFGVYHSGLTIFPRNISFDISDFTKPVNALHTDKPQRIDSSTSEKYNIGEENVTFRILGENDNNQYYENNGTVSLSLLSYTTQPDDAKYRVSFYKNHQLVKINDSYEYVDVSVEKGKYSVTDLIINDVQAGDFIYCVAVPLDFVNNSMPYKTQSTFILSNNAKTEQTTEEHTTTSAIISEPEISVITSETQITSSEMQIQTEIVVSQPAEVTTMGIETTTADVDNNADTGISEQSSTVTDISLENTMLLCSGKSGLLIGSADSGDLVLSLTEDGVNIVNSVRLGSEDISIDKVKSVSDGYSVIYLLNESAYGVLLDSELNIISQINITDILGREKAFMLDTVDITQNQIYYAVDDKVFSCDLNGNNKRQTAQIAGNTGNASISAISVTEKYIAVKASSRADGMRKEYYGVADGSGNITLREKSNIQAPRSLGNTVIWSDTHLERGKNSSGKIIVFNGSYAGISTSRTNESQYAFLCDEDMIIAYEDADNAVVFNVYKNGIVTDSVTAETGGIIYGSPAIHSGHIYANVIIDGKLYLKSWTIE